MDVRMTPVTKREILEVALATDIADVRALLAPLFRLDTNDVADLRADDDGDPAVRYEHMTMPGSFQTKLTLYVDPARANGITTDEALAKGLVAATNSRALASLPPDHPKAADPGAWMLFAPGALPRLVHEKPRDDDGIDLH